MASAGQVTPEAAARIAGIGYLLQMATGIAGYAVRVSLGVPGDATATASQIIAAESLYRLSLVGDLVTVATVLVVTWALYVLLCPVNRDLAALAVLFRLVENAILAVITVYLLAALPTLAPAEYLAPFRVEQAHALGRLARTAHAAGFNVAFIFLGLGSALFAYLLYVSRAVPRGLAGWGIAASLLLTVGAATILLVPTEVRAVQLVSFPPMFIFEVGLGGWLLWRGARVMPH